MFFARELVSALSNFAKTAAIDVHDIVVVVVFVSLFCCRFSTNKVKVAEIRKKTVELSKKL